MLLLVFLVFTGVFVVAALLLVASGTGASERTKQTLARLDAILAANTGGVQKDELVDIRKEELLSAIPLLNRLLLRLEVAPKLRRLLYQADVKWTPGGVLLMSVTCCVIIAYLAYLRTGAVLISLIFGLLAAFLPFGYLLFETKQALQQVRGGASAGTRSDGERSAGRTEPGLGHRTGWTRVAGSDRPRVPHLLRRAELWLGIANRHG